MIIIPIEGQCVPMPVPEGTVRRSNNELFEVYCDGKWREVEYIEGVWLLVDNGEYF